MILPFVLTYIPKKCVIRKKRCFTHRQDLTEVLVWKQVLDRSGGLAMKKVQVPKFVCRGQEERKTNWTGSLGKDGLVGADNDSTEVLSCNKMYC